MPKKGSGTFNYPGGKTTLSNWIIEHFLTTNAMSNLSAVRLRFYSTNLVRTSKSITTHTTASLISSKCAATKATTFVNG